VYQLAPVSPNA